MMGPEPILSLTLDPNGGAVPPIPDNICTVQEEWKITGTEEILVNTWHVQLQSGGATFNVGGNWRDLTQELADQWLAHKTTHWDELANWHAATAYIDTIKTYHLDNTGHTIDKGVAVVGGPNILVGHGGGPLPPEVAILLRLNCIPPGEFTGRPRRRKGRVYLGPVPKNVIDGSGQFFIDNADLLVQHYGSWLNDVQGMHLGENGEIFPNVGVLSRTAGEFHQMESVTCPKNLGVQRRRQNKLINTVSNAVTINHS